MALVLVLPGQVLAQVPKVYVLRLVGVKTVPKKKARERLVDLQPPGFWKFWQEHPGFTEEKLNNGIKKIQQIYREEGFYHAKVKSQVFERNQRIIITITVEEGPRVIIKDIVFEIKNGAGNEWEKEFRQLIPLYKDGIFQVSTYEKAKTRILEYLANNGYPRAKLSGKVLVYENKNEAEIHFLVEPSVLTHFGRIELSGNKNISSAIIWREITFAEGETFSMSKVFQSQTRIYGLNFFSSVLLEPKGLSPGTGPVDIKVMIQERRPRTVEAGLGYGTEDKLRFRLSGVYRNFIGGARELRLSLRFSALTEEGSLTFTQPYFPDPASVFRSKLSRIIDKFVSFDTTTTSIENLIERKLTSSFSVFLAHRLDSYEVTKLSEVTDKELDFLQEQVYFLSYFQTGFKWDTSDSPINPTTGSVMKLFIEPSLQAIGSEVSYLKQTLEYKNYYQIFWGQTNDEPLLASRISIGTIQPFGLNQRGVPLFKRFFSGGTYSVRGYSYQELGPHDQSGKPIGGNSLFEGSLEFRFPLWGKLWGVNFCDFGNVYLDSWQFELNDLRYCLGAGIRYQTVIGPFRFDFGYILNPDDLTTRPYRFHFSIGQAF